MQLSLTINLADMGATWLKTFYLTGFTFLDGAGKELPDSWYEFHILNAIAKFREYTGIDIIPMNYEERQDYHATDWSRYSFLQLQHWPVLAVDGVEGRWDNSGNSVAIFPPQWTVLEAVHGQINLMPVQGGQTAIIIGAGADWFPFLFTGASYVPHFWWVKYHTGFKNNEIPRTMADAVAKLTCFEFLPIIGDSIYPVGVNTESVSLDGASQSRSYAATAFNNRIETYKKHLWGDPQQPRDVGQLQQLKNNYIGIPMASV